MHIFAVAIINGNYMSRLWNSHHQTVHISSTEVNYISVVYIYALSLSRGDQQNSFCDFVRLLACSCFWRICGLIWAQWEHFRLNFSRELKEQWRLESTSVVAERSLEFKSKSIAHFTRFAATRFSSILYPFQDVKSCRVAETTLAHIQNLLIIKQSRCERGSTVCS